MIFGGAFLIGIEEWKNDPKKEEGRGVSLYARPIGSELFQLNWVGADNDVYRAFGFGPPQSKCPLPLFLMSCLGPTEVIE